MEGAHDVAEVGAIPETKDVSNFVGGGVNHCVFRHEAPGRSLGTEFDVGGDVAGEVIAAPVKNLALPDSKPSDICPHIPHFGLEIDADVGFSGFDFDKVDFSVESFAPEGDSLVGGGTGFGALGIGNTISVYGELDISVNENRV